MLAALRKAAQATTLILLLMVFCGSSTMAFSQESLDRNLIKNGDFLTTTAFGDPSGFESSGDVKFGPLGDPERERFGTGFRLISAAEGEAKTVPQGSVITTVGELSPNNGRWYRFRVRGLAQNGFDVDQDDLYLQANFFSNHGKDSLDNVTQKIYHLVELDRKNLYDKGTNVNLGPSSLRSYDLEFHTPFPEVDTLKLLVGFGLGKGVGRHAEFWVASEQLTPIPVPEGYTPPKGGHLFLSKDMVSKMVPLGGRWYYDSRGASPTPPAEFNYGNADRLLYLSDRLEAPFEDNMSSWLRKGDVDLNGNLADKDTPVPYNVVVTFTPTDLVIHSRNLPNHPTAVFPDTTDLLDGNPNYISEKVSTWYIPLYPKVDPQHWAMENGSDQNRALNMGPIGVAVNGIVFFNPFDAGQQVALYRIDRCCGHPSPDGQYHYHKYPVCVKSPWADNGDEHSPLIGFAFDGFPIYGPYEAKGILAKDDKSNPLNAFNIHYDADRGWHYHVTPGLFPHIIGGYWGYYDTENRMRPGM